MKEKTHLNVLICRTLRGDSVPFKLVIDGDVFYCSMKKVVFDEVHFRQRLIDLKNYVFSKKEGDAYDSGYFDALEHVLKMMENN